MTVGFPPSITATTEFVVPKSIPTDFAMVLLDSHETFDQQWKKKRGSAPVYSVSCTVIKPREKATDYGLM
jgi:hypothetical protein